MAATARSSEASRFKKTGEIWAMATFTLSRPPSTGFCVFDMLELPDAPRAEPSARRRGDGSWDCRAARRSCLELSETLSQARGGGGARLAALARSVLD